MTDKKHWLGRPPRDAVDVLRLAGNGRWVEDDGKTPGRAFSGKSPDGFPIAWGPECDCWGIADRCPMRLAMSKTCERFCCANGRRMRRLRVRR